MTIVSQKAWTEAREEGTKGVDPGGLGLGTYLVVIDNFDAQEDYEQLRRDAHSPFAPGHRTRRGMVSFPWSCGVDTFALDIADANSEPLNWVMWRVAGFGPLVYDAGPPQTLTSTLLSCNHASVTLKHFQKDAQGVIRTRWQLLGAMADFTLSGTSAEPLRLELSNGLAMSGSGNFDDATAIPDLDYDDSEGNFELPLVCESVALTHFSSVEAVPETYSNRLKNFELNGNRTITALSSMTAVNGLSEVFDSANNYRELSFQVVKEETTSWDPYTYMRESIPVEITLRLHDVTNTAHRFYIHGFWQIETVTESSEEEEQVYTITCHGLFDESDGWTTGAVDGVAADPGQRAADVVTVRWEAPAP